MQISCPVCTTSYDLPDVKIGAKGRTVKCATCGNKWHAKADNEEDDKQAVEDGWESVMSTSSSLLPTLPDTGGGSASSDNEPDGEEDVALANISAATRSFKAQKPFDPLMRSNIELQGQKQISKARPEDIRSYWIRGFIGPALFVIIGLFVGGLVYFKTPVVRQFPDLASLYNLIGVDVNLRGLEFVNIRSERVVESSGPVLVVSGVVHNVSQSVIVSPLVRFGLRTNIDEEVYSWTHRLTEDTLIPGSRVAFRSRLPQPPAVGRNLQLRFVDK